MGPKRSILKAKAKAEPSKETKARKTSKQSRRAVRYSLVMLIINATHLRTRCRASCQEFLARRRLAAALQLAFELGHLDGVGRIRARSGEHHFLIATPA